MDSVGESIRHFIETGEGLSQEIAAQKSGWGDWELDHQRQLSYFESGSRAVLADHFGEQHSLVRSFDEVRHGGTLPGRIDARLGILSAGLLLAK